jgi:hypothetical protein
MKKTRKKIVAKLSSADVGSYRLVPYSLRQYELSKLQGYPTPSSPPITNNKVLRATSFNMSSREASHAGSWYTDDGHELSTQLDGWLNAVPSKAEGIGAQSSKEAPVDLPSAGARAIIAP